MNTTGTSPLRRRSGNALIDTILVLPILLALAFGTVEFGYFFYVKHAVQGAARESARAAVVPGAAFADINTAITNALANTGVSSFTYNVKKNATVINAGNFSTLIGGDPLTVTVQASWGTVGLHPLGLISSDKQVTGSAAMRKEGT